MAAVSAIPDIAHAPEPERADGAQYKPKDEHTLSGRSRSATVGAVPNMVRRPCPHRPRRTGVTRACGSVLKANGGCDSGACVVCNSRERLLPLLRRHPHPHLHRHRQLLPQPQHRWQRRHLPPPLLLHLSLRLRRHQRLHPPLRRLRQLQWLLQPLRRRRLPWPHNRRRHQLLALSWRPPASILPLARPRRLN